MATKYTPGPWKLEPLPNNVWNVTHHITQTGRELPVAMVQGEANAALLAAAPELAEALQACLTAIDVALQFEGDVFGVHHNDTQDSLHKARHALQKAGLVS